MGQIISSTNANGNDVSPPPLVLCLQFEKWMTFPLRSMNEDVTKPKTEITRMVPPGGIRSMVRRATLDEEYRKVMGNQFTNVVSCSSFLIVIVKLKCRNCVTTTVVIIVTVIFFYLNPLLMSVYFVHSISNTAQISVY